MLKIRLPAGLAKAIEVSASRDRQLDRDQRTRSKSIGWIREREESAGSTGVREIAAWLMLNSKPLGN